MRRSILITPSLVKQEAQRRIEEAYPLWRQVNIMRDGDTAQIEAMGKGIDAIRAASNKIEEMQPIPHDYQAAKYWPIGL